MPHDLGLHSVLGSLGSSNSSHQSLQLDRDDFRFELGGHVLTLLCCLAPTMVTGLPSLSLSLDCW